MVKKQRKKELLEFYNSSRRCRPLLCNINLYAQTLQVELLVQPMGIAMPAACDYNFTSVEQALLDCRCIIKALEESVFLYKFYLGRYADASMATLKILEKKLAAEKAEAALLQQYEGLPINAVNVIALFTYTMDNASARISNLVVNLVNKMKKEN